MRGRVFVGVALVVAGGLAIVVVRSHSPGQARDTALGGRQGAAGAGQVSIRESLPVQARLVADVAIIQPGATFRLGVMFRIRPGWHIFWKNPGARGEPTAIAIRLPGGFLYSGPLQWPVPSRFTLPGGAVDYGYRDRVLLARGVRASNLDPDRDWRLAADVSWVACNQTCRPGRTTVELWLPPSISGTRLTDPANRRRFDEWSARMPFDPGSPDRPFTAKALVDGPSSESAGAIVTLRWNAAPAAVEWFPSAPTEAAFPRAAVKTDGRLTRIAFRPRARAEDGLAPSAMSASDGQATRAIEGVVSYTDATGTRRGAALAVALEPPSGR